MHLKLEIRDPRFPLRHANGPCGILPPQQVAPNWRGGMQVRPCHLAVERHQRPSAEPRKSGVSEASEPWSPVVVILRGVLLPWSPPEVPLEQLGRVRRNLHSGCVQRKCRVFHP